MGPSWPTMDKLPAVGDVYVALLPTRVPPGHEQHGHRPVVVVGRPEPARFPMVIAIPLSSRVGAWQPANPGLYPILAVGSGGLVRESVALIDHVQGVDERRLVSWLGALTLAEQQPLADGLRLVLGL